MTEKTPPTIEELAGTNRFAMMTTQSAAGLVSRPMTVQEYADGVFRFVTQRNTDVAQQSDGQQVNFTMSSDSTWVSISGHGSLNHDVELKKRLWNIFNDAYAEGGPENPENVVLEIDPDQVSYWDTPGGVVHLLQVVKAAVTGTKPSGSEHGTLSV